MELIRSGSLAQACRKLPPSLDVRTLDSLRATLDYFQLPTQELLSMTAIQASLQATKDLECVTGDSHAAAPAACNSSMQLLRLAAFLSADATAQQLLQLLDAQLAKAFEPSVMSARFVVEAVPAPRGASSAPASGDPKPFAVRVFMYRPPRQGWWHSIDEYVSLEGTSLERDAELLADAAGSYLQAVAGIVTARTSLRASLVGIKIRIKFQEKHLSATALELSW